ncbi:MAG: Bcr/CflA family efflux MFS transporter [Chitinophagaceae bacterium]|nr:MAG: Bcr/CflA family efflux MFS transporter [Chitinophagaceae bacterium]
MRPRNLFAGVHLSGYSSEFSQQIEPLNKAAYFKLILVLGSLTALGPFSIDMYLPGFSAIAKDLHTSVNQVALSLSTYFIGISAGQLLYGPLLDRYGRKKPLYLGLLLYIAASVGCAVALDVKSLIVLRFIQAVGSCAAAVAAMAMVNDLFPIRERPKVFSLLLLVVGLSPLLAPTIGSYVIGSLGWHAIFLILTAMGVLVLLASWLGLPQTRKPDPDISLKPRPIISNFLQILKTPQFYTYALSGSFAFSGLFTYVSGSPILFMDIFKVSAEAYGWIFAIMSVSFIGTSQLTSLLLKKFNSQQLVLFGISLQVVLSTIILVAAVCGWLGLYSTIALLFIYLGSLGLTNPNTSALALAPFTTNGGSAAALLGALQLGISALISMVVGFLFKDSIVPFAAILLFGAFTGLVILLAGRRNISSFAGADAGAGAVMH